MTGAGSGIGKATALKLAAEGAGVAVLSRTESEVLETCRDIEPAAIRQFGDQLFSRALSSV
ncbi:3-ketoacyl-(acyl-carrier-protein) reductase [Rhizobium sp. Pop5]|nr:3-ketoacyl-(acyl-carrier-protein) reductase [Rhizobium sp. Pop5]